MENNKIEIDVLVDGYAKCSTVKEKNEYLKSNIIINDYLGYALKVSLADNIIEVSCISNGNVHIDSCKKELMRIHALLSNYTNINYGVEDIVFKYDSLERYGLIDKIIAMIPEKEVQTFSEILDMKQKDLMTNKYEIHAYLSEKLNKLIPDFIKAINPIAQKVGKTMDSIDTEKVEKAIEKGFKLLS